MLNFGSVQLDVDARETVLDGEIQHLEPQAFDLLVFLVDHRDRVVPKAELLDEVWGDQFVSESALTTRIKEIRRATGDDGRSQSVIKNVRGRGYRFVASLDDTSEPAASGGQSMLRSVPSPPLTPSIGLDGEIRRLAELSDTRRLITIVGPGGVGKTRLSLEVGRAVAPRHALGARVVELSRISEPAAILPSIWRALDRSESSRDLTNGLGAVDALLVLDNCEHIIAAVADAVPSLLSGGEQLHILATSREALGVPGEQRWALAPLSAVGADAPAMQLFVERARDAAVDVDPDDPLAQSIVSHLDGIPLALEMAAARLATMGLADVADEMERSVASLAAGQRGVADRHSTLRAVLAWSEELLTEEQGTVLADFAVFAGPVDASDLPAAVDAPDPVGEVCALAERSLVTVDTSEESRALYGSLETVREFGRERLRDEGRLDSVRRRHTEWFTAAVEAVSVMYDSPQQHLAVRRIDAIWDEIRAAHLWARSNDPALAIRISRAIYLPSLYQLRLEVFEWALALAEQIDSDHEGAAELFAQLSQGLSFVGRIDEAQTWADRAIAVARSPLDCRVAYTTLADLTLYSGDLERSLQYAQTHNGLVEQRGSRIERACGKTSLALPLAYLGRRDEALEHLPDEPPEDSPPSAWAWLAYGRGEVLLDVDPEAALRQLESAIELTESVDDFFLSGVSHVSAASLRARTGHPEDAIVPFARTITRLTDRGNTTHLLTTLRNLPSLLVRLEAWEGAAQILGGLSTATISPSYGDEADRLAQAEDTARSALGAATFEEAYQLGAARSLIGTARHAIAILNDPATVG